MYQSYTPHPCPCYLNAHGHNFNDFSHKCPYFVNTAMYPSDFSRQPPLGYFPFSDEMESNSSFDSSEDRLTNLKDYGPRPYVVNINEASNQNKTFRTALWTGKYLQVTLMSINVGEDIGLEIHPDTDQFLRIEAGQGIVRMGSHKNKLDFKANISNEIAIMIPAGTWHNVINTGNKPLKLYSIYAPPHHPHGTVHKTQADAEAAGKAVL